MNVNVEGNQDTLIQPKRGPKRRDGGQQLLSGDLPS